MSPRPESGTFDDLQITRGATTSRGAVGHAQGLFLYAFGIFIVIMFATSLRTNAVVVLALGILIATIRLPGERPPAAAPTGESR